jgi:hypothetical protein
LSNNELFGLAICTVLAGAANCNTHRARGLAAAIGLLHGRKDLLHFPAGASVALGRNRQDN